MRRAQIEYLTASPSRRMIITVAVACYNQEGKIATCLESVIAQDYDDLEILVVDDHSTDRSVEIINSVIKSHPERQFQILVHDVNQGIAQVRNTCISNAQGDAILFIDCDDTMVDNCIGTFGRQMKETGADVVCGSFRMVDEQWNIIREYKYPKGHFVSEFAFSSFIEKHIIDNIWFPQTMSNKLYSLGFLRDCGIRCDTSFRCYEDIPFTFKVALKAKNIVVLDKISYNWVQLSTSISHRALSQSLLSDICSCLQTVFFTFSDFRSSYIGKIPKGLFYLLNFNCLTSGILKHVIQSNLDKSEKKSFLKWLRSMYRNNNLRWRQVVGFYNRTSYLILNSLFPYPLFRCYFRHLKIITKIVKIFK